MRRLVQETKEKNFQYVQQKKKKKDILVLAYFYIFLSPVLTTKKSDLMKVLILKAP